MKDPKTLTLIECSSCGGCYYGGDVKLVLNPGNERELPDELYMLVRKVSKCVACKEKADRTLGGGRRKFDR